ncbi:LytTR family DNA-binding domain-containing protein [Anaerotignum propionicum]|uniref:LytR/AlgR family response regulator transcription factor n=1 Tax=Anaerotignum propionicum TaxID=28446 RepID=UPI0028A2B6B9|nr:LytTR family DNA-binding domain-containing protein [Anaerotignum propionicum]
MSVLSSLPLMQKSLLTTKYYKEVTSMLRIAICDDHPEELEVNSEYIREYLDTHTLEAEIKEFSHPDKILTTIETESFHLYILDIVMPMVSGIELGKEIRRIDREAQIIYATTEPQFALQAYAASPINYLVKPINKALLFDTLTLAISKADLAEEQTYAVKTADSLRVIKLSEIVCCEYRNHTVLFFLSNGEEVQSRTIRESFAKYTSLILKDRHFLQCHTAFVVNLRRVERFAKDSFTLCGGKIIPIAVKQYAAVRDTYMDYLMARGSNND